jgi:tRNA threonylcarbamoyladenosine biosynthesis protein TsaB
LAIDTATDVGAVAVSVPGSDVREVRIADRRHAAALIPEAAALLESCGVGWGDLSEIVVADGPGSFTGLRIGFASVRGVLHAHPRIALRTVPSLLGTAWAAREGDGDTVAALYDALRGEVFAAVYRFTAGVPDALVSPTLVEASALRSLPRPRVVVGDGAGAYPADVRAWVGSEPPYREGGASARALLELALVEGVTDSIVDPDAWDPTYGRRAAAQDRWEADHGRPLPDPTGD